MEEKDLNTLRQLKAQIGFTSDGKMLCSFDKTMTLSEYIKACEICKQIFLKYKEVNNYE